MPKAAEIISAISVETGTPVDDVTELARRLREQPPGGELWVRETRSPQSPRATFRHCANLIAALLADQPAKHAGKTISQIENAILESGSLKHACQCDPFEGALKTLQKPDHSFIDALEALIREAENDFTFFEKRFRYTSISFEKNTMSGAIELRISDHLPFLLSTKKEVAVRLSYCNLSMFHDGELRRESTIGCSTIARVGRLLAKDSL